MVLRKTKLKATATTAKVAYMNGVNAHYHYIIYFNGRCMHDTLPCSASYRLTYLQIARYMAVIGSLVVSDAEFNSDSGFHSCLFMQLNRLGI